FLQLQYNIEPAHLKRRGLAGSGVFGVASVGLPLVLGYTALTSHLDAAGWLIFSGAAVLSVARTVWWAIPDHTADHATGIDPPTVRYGPVRALVVACLLLVTGLVLLGWGLWWRYGAAWCAAGIAAPTRVVG